MRRIIVLVMVMIGVFRAVAQPPEAVPVRIFGEDGKALVGIYYPAAAENAPSVLLLHQLYTNSTSWQSLIPKFQANGYAVLTPDLRGYGQTRGTIDWREAQTDTQLWIDWLRAQPETRDDRISVLGSSMGANLAVIGCADDNVANPEVGCIAAVAISPGLNYFGYTPLEPALAEGLVERSVLMISSQNDGYAARATRQLPEDAPGPVEVIWVEGNAHGIDLLGETVTSLMMIWLNMHGR